MLPDVSVLMDVSQQSAPWWEPVEKDGTLLWRVWVGDMCVMHSVLRKALELARQKVQREGNRASI